MKITVFTSNQPRHLHLISEISRIADQCYAVLETNTVFPGQRPDFFKKTEVFQEYFSHVMASEKKIFGDISFSSNARQLVIKSGDLNLLSRPTLEPALDSDFYIVFGASFIKGWLIDFLVKRKAINIHMGMSPYYRGSSCNFWASYDGNYHLVGATIHMLSKGLDNGDMLYHVAPTTKDCNTPFDFTMRTVKSAHKSLVSRIADKSIFSFKPIAQDRSQEIRYTKNIDFSDAVARDFLGRKLSIDEIEEGLSRNKCSSELYNPYYASEVT